MLLTEYNEIETMELFKEEGREEGRIEGRQEGRIEGRQEGREEGRIEGREEGREEGRILQTIELYRILAHYNDEQILDIIQEKFSLNEEEAEYYLRMERDSK